MEKFGLVNGTTPRPEPPKVEPTAYSKSSLRVKRNKTLQYTILSERTGKVYKNNNKELGRNVIRT